MIDLGNKHLNEQKIVPLVARFQNIYLLYEAHFFLLLGTYFILFYIKYTKLFIKSMFLMLLF